MIDNPREYEVMAQVEASHWWYRALHRAVLDAIQQQFPSRQIKILDAGCGTGGLLNALTQDGYASVQGFDLSPVAVGICRDRGLQVEVGNLSDIDSVDSPSRFDVIVSNDVLYHLPDGERKKFIAQAFERLNSGGLLIMNLPALAGFRGQHDRAVGVTHRFNRTEFRQLFAHTGFEAIKLRYWPVVLAPAIYLVRTWQRMTDDQGSSTLPKSDLKNHAGLLNSILYRLIRLEMQYLPWTPAGSSLFTVLRRP